MESIGFSGCEYHATYNSTEQTFSPNPNQPNTFQEFLELNTNNEQVMYGIHWAVTGFEMLHQPKISQ